jgi:hypothetical protein
MAHETEKYAKIAARGDKMSPTGSSDDGISEEKLVLVPQTIGGPPLAKGVELPAILIPIGCSITPIALV